MEKNTILKISDLNVSFGEHSIIKDFNLDLKRDATLAVVGPNGSGKSVLFKAMLNLISYQGTIEWAQDVRVGYVPQKILIPTDLPLTVIEFLKLKENNLEKINKRLIDVGFKAKATHVHHDVRVLGTKLSSLSGGELQRILIAYALLGNPNVLLLDEPTAGVDIEGEETFYGLFERLQKDTDLTIIFISHDPQVVNKYSDKIVELIHKH